MGVQIPVGFVGWTLEFALAGHTSPYYITGGCNKDVAQDANDVAFNIGNTYLDEVFNPSGANAGDDWTLVTCKTSWNQGGGVVSLGEYVMSAQGTVTGNNPPPNAACLVQKLTGLAGRRNRGRLYVPPHFLSETNVNNAGVIDASTRSALQTRFDDWFDAIALGDNEMLLFHSDGSVPSVITSLNLQALMATQRNRLR